jgi:hypothetical protein
VSAGSDLARGRRYPQKWDALFYSLPRSQRCSPGVESLYGLLHEQSGWVPEERVYPVPIPAFTVG